LSADYGKSRKVSFLIRGRKGKISGSSQNRQYSRLHVVSSLGVNKGTHYGGRGKKRYPRTLEYKSAKRERLLLSIWLWAVLNSGISL